VTADDFRITDSHYGSRWSFDVCGFCGFVFSNPFLPADDLLRFYEQLDDREYAEEAEGRGRNFSIILDRLESLLPPGRKLLDVGAASGIFLNLARKRGYDVQGIEPSRSLASEARKRYGIELFNGTLDRFEIGPVFSVIVLLDILEHLADPVRFMEDVSHRMGKGGLLAVVTPDIGSLAARMAGRRWWHFRIAHVAFFNRRSLRFLLETHGFEIVLQKRYAWNFSLFYLLTRLLPRLKSSRALQKHLKKIHLKLPLRDSWEIYARKK
jgi:2-polyprenyl-3-methyl-5-hydroxy-6-metoxy-1,4-benzoquinol methylase